VFAPRVPSSGAARAKRSTGEQELYNENSDPFEMTNLVNSDPTVLAAM
jgi:hypothetical protein